MIDGGSPLPGWERGPPDWPAPASRISNGSPQGRQRGRGAKAAQEENIPKLTASTSGSLPSPVASPSHLAQDTHGTACATNSPVPTEPARPAAHRLSQAAGSRAPAANPVPGQPRLPGGRQLGPSPAMAEEAQPCWPSPGPQPLLRHPQRECMWGPSPMAGGLERAAGQAGRAWQRLLAGLPVGPGAGGAQPAPGIALAAARPVAGRAGGNPILPGGTSAPRPDLGC